MRNQLIVDLAECTEFRQTLQARPPRLVHGCVLLLIALLTTAVLWAALTRADLVVRAGGRVRPTSTPTRVFTAGRGEVLSGSAGGRVIEVRFQPGQAVRQGDVLLRLDTGRLDTEIARRQRTIAGGAEELTRLAGLESAGERQAEATRAKADAELVQAVEEVRQAKERQAADVRLAEVELEAARDDEGRLRRLVPVRAATAADMVKATSRRQEALEKREKARLPIDASRVAVLRRARELADQELAVKREELVMKRRTRQAEVEAARLELASLELERRQAVIVAPCDGVVTTGEIKVGDLLEAGKSMVEIAAQEGFRFEAAVPSEEVAHLRPGMPVRVRLDACDYQKYGTMAGTVCFLSPDSAVPEGEKMACYLVRIDLDGTTVGRGDVRAAVKLGMTGQADIVTDQESLLVLLLRKIRQTISLG